jgi:hypothetical protein
MSTALARGMLFALVLVAPFWVGVATLMVMLKS